MPTQLVSPKRINWHAHLRQGQNLTEKLMELHKQAGIRGLVAMPNTLPPVTRVFGRNTAESWSMENYRDFLFAAAEKVGLTLDYLEVPLYLSAHTTPKLIEEGAKAGFFTSAKSYPPHGTTNASLPGEHRPISILEHYKRGNLQALQDNNIILKIHGEVSLANDLIPHNCTDGLEHKLPNYLWYDNDHMNAEALFYREVMPSLRDHMTRRQPWKHTGEHVTTPEAVAYIDETDNTFATVCPQHLLKLLGDLLKDMNTFLNCMPLVKTVMAQLILLGAVTAPDNTKYGAGDDDAPHLLNMKHTPCGCAAGCCCTACAPQLYAEAFEFWRTGFGSADKTSPTWRAFEQFMPTEAETFLDLPKPDLDTSAGQDAFRNFLIHTGHNFHNVPVSTETFTMERTPQTFTPVKVELEKPTKVPTLIGITEIDHDYLVQLPIGLNWRKEIEEESAGVKSKRLRRIDEQSGTTTWSIVPNAA